tara:strand:+ start:747 stop:1415 length:669 start_codon:yes stop_codon:yes gene_type:complete
MKFLLPLKIEIPSTIGEFKAGLMFRESLDEDSGMLFMFDSIDYHSFHMDNTTIPLDIAFIDKWGIIESIKELRPLSRDPVGSDNPVLFALEVNRGWFDEHNVQVGDKVLSEDVAIEDSSGNIFADVIDIVKPEPLRPTPSNIHYVSEATRLPNYQNIGQIISVALAWRGRNYMLQMFFPQVKKPSRREVQDQVRKVYPGAKLWSYQVSDYDPGEPLLQTGGR